MNQIQQQKFKRTYREVRMNVTPANKAQFEMIVRWVLEELAKLLFRDGQFKKPSIWQYGKLILFVLTLAVKIPEMLLGEKD